MNRDWLWLLILAAVTFVAYEPAWNGAPIWDDNGHLTKPELRSLHGLEEIWFHLGATQQYYPMVHSVFWLESRLWGNSTLGYHWLNILLHVFSAFFLVKILRYLHIAGAWPAAAIFVLHPIQVESVAWISELKNALSTVFFLGAALAYLKFDTARNRGQYALAAVLFFLGLMSKSVIAPLSVVLLAVFWWKRGRVTWARDIVPLAPFFLVGIASGLFTSWVEHRFVIGNDTDDLTFTFIDRILIAGRAFWFYPGKLIWPAHLIFIYPRWHINASIWWQYCFPVAAMILAATVWVLRRRTRAPIAGFLYYSVMIFPALGFFNVYPLRFSFVADHFQHLACIGLIVPAIAALEAAPVFRGVSGRSMKAILFGAVLAIFCVLTWRQCGMYVDADTVYRKTLEGNPACWMAHYNLANATLHQGHPGEAIDHYRKTIEIKPNYILAYISLGNTLMETGHTDEGIAVFRKATEVDPTSIAALVDLGNSLMLKNSLDDAIVQYRRALALSPGFATAYYNLGNALLQAGRAGEAAGSFQKALECEPGNVSYITALRNVYLRMGRLDDAIRTVQDAVNAAQSSGRISTAMRLEEDLGKLQEIQNRRAHR
jgi:tetratricopeptide (TPR) repeat protein